MESLETLRPEPIFTNGQSTSLEPFPSTQSSSSLMGIGQSTGNMMLNNPIVPEPVALTPIAAEASIVASSRTISGEDSLTGRSAGFSRDELLNKGLVYYEDFEGRFQQSKVTDFFLQSGPSNSSGSGFKKWGAEEFNNSYATSDLVTGSAAAYGDGALSLMLKKNNSRAELGQANKFNETYFSGEGNDLWVGVSIKIDPTYTKGDGGTRIIQLKRNYKPGHQKSVGRPPFSVFYDAGKSTLNAVINREFDGAGKSFSLGKVERGQWHDFVIHTHWSSTSKGLTELWLNGQQKIDYKGPNISAYHADDKNTRTSVQIGVYKSGGVPGDSKVHLDELRIAANDGFYDIVKPGGMLKAASPKPDAEKPKPVTETPPVNQPSRPPENNPTLIGIPQNAFRGKYYDSKDFSQLKATRIDQAVNFDWGSGSPVSGVGKDTFSAIWEGDFTFDQGTYEFASTTDDGMEVLVDGKTVIGQMFDQVATLYKEKVNLSKGTHRVEVRYYENGGDAVAKVNWQKVTSQPASPSVLPPIDSKIRVEAESNLVDLNPVGRNDRMVSSKGASGGKAYAMYHGNATATFKFTGESGNYGLNLNAKADLYKGSPMVSVSQNNSRQTWNTEISSTSYKLHKLNVPTLSLKKGDTITLKFDNDLYEGSSRKDRNLYLDYLEFVPQVK